MRKTLLAVLVSALPLSPAQAAPETVSNLADQRALSVTVYNDDLALIKDSREIVLGAGEQRLAWRDVSAMMRPETALLRSPAAPGLKLVEQNFDFDLLTPAKLLEKHVGQTVTVVRSHPTTGEETRETATVLATHGGVVLQFADRIETGVSGRLAFAGVPGTLRDRPTLVITLDNPAAGAKPLELAYLTGGLSWRADYVAELSADERTLDLGGWVTLTNRSGTAYPNARLQLVAGQLNRVHDAPPGARPMMAMAAKLADAAEMQQESLFEYHLYTLPRPTTLADNQTKQVALLSAGGVGVKKTLRFQGGEYYFTSQSGEIGQKLKAAVHLEFANKGAGLGVPLPRGVVRVYKKDSRGHAQFVGEDRIDHTPRNETVRLYLGEAFDVTADKRQTAFQKIAGSARTQVFESAYEIVVKNAKDEPVTVSLREPMPGEWTVLAESHPHAKLDARTAEWTLTVPAEGQTTLSFRVRNRL